MSSPEDHVPDALADVLADFDDWQREHAKDGIKDALLDRAARRYVEKWGMPPVATRSTDWVCCQMLSETERRIWLALEDA